MLKPGAESETVHTIQARRPLEQNANIQPDSGKPQNIVKLREETSAVRPGAEAPKSHCWLAELKPSDKYVRRSQR